MKELNNIFNEFHAIQNSYCGDATDWSVAKNKLDELYNRCRALRIRDGKNFHYYNFIKYKLQSTIMDEALRIQKKIPFI